MKTVVLYFAVLLLETSVLAQSRDSAQAVVPRGYENMDSVRFNLFDMEAPIPHGKSRAYMDSLADDFQATFESGWGDLAPNVMQGKRKGVLARSAFEPLSLGHIGIRIKQRQYFPSPTQLKPQVSNGFFWRYNDVNIDSALASWHHNKYDENDINPYAEYRRNASIISGMFISCSHFVEITLAKTG